MGEKIGPESGNSKITHLKAVKEAKQARAEEEIDTMAAEGSAKLDRDFTPDEQAYRLARTRDAILTAAARESAEQLGKPIPLRWNQEPKKPMRKSSTKKPSSKT